jgi:serine/threonine protein kinase
LRDPESDAGRTFDELVEMNPLWQQMLGITHALCRITEYHTQDASQEPLFGYHFDLKPANILVEMSNNWVISDFGQATFREVNGTSSRVIGNAGTETYAPPEMADVDMKQSRKYDVWSLGCILLEVATFITQRHAGVQKLDEIRISKAEGSNSNGENDWYYHQDKGTQEYEVKPQISKWLKDLPKSEAIRTTNSTYFMEEIVSLAEKMLNVDVEKRITARDAYLTLRNILTRYRPRLINATDAETAIGEIDIDSNEIEVGKMELASIEYDFPLSAHPQ